MYTMQELKNAIVKAEINVGDCPTEKSFKIFKSNLIQNFSEEICHYFRVDFLEEFKSNGFYLVPAVKETLIKNLDIILN